MIGPQNNKASETRVTFCEFDNPRQSFFVGAKILVHIDRAPGPSRTSASGWGSSSVHAAFRERADRRGEGASAGADPTDRLVYLAAVSRCRSAAPLGRSG